MASSPRPRCVIGLPELKEGVRGRALVSDWYFCVLAAKERDDKSGREING